jgi:hypothetical protein
MKGGLSFGESNNDAIYSGAALGIKLNLQENS